MKAKERKSKEEIMKELACLGHLIRGSLVRTHRKCGKPTAHAPKAGICIRSAFSPRR